MDTKPSREIFDKRGRPYDEESKERMEERSRKKHVEEGERVEEMEDFVESVDFELLRDIFEEHVRQSGLDPESLNFIGPDRIAHSSFENIVPGEREGVYDPAKNLIGINFHNVDRVAGEIGVETEDRLLYILSHEQVHATSRVKCYTLERAFWQKLLEYGLKRGEFSSGKKEIGYYKGGTRDFGMFSQFNEGVAEKIGREVFAEYNRRTNRLSDEEVDEFFRKVKDDGRLYQYSVDFVDALVERISRESGVSEQVVWSGFVRGMFEGGALQNSEIEEAFSEMFGSDFYNELSRAINDQDMKDLTLKYLKEGDINEESIDRLSEVSA